MDYIILNAIDKPYFRGGVFMQNLMEISFDYYKVFYEVARSHSITLAASHLCLTQPTVTKYIKNLEAVLNCQLFLRSQKGVSLTSEVSAFIARSAIPASKWDRLRRLSGNT